MIRLARAIWLIAAALAAVTNILIAVLFPGAFRAVGAPTGTGTALFVTIGVVGDPGFEAVVERVVRRVLRERGSG